jgi:hypothetical protein
MVFLLGLVRRQNKLHMNGKQVSLSVDYIKRRSTGEFCKAKKSELFLFSRGGGGGGVYRSKITKSCSDSNRKKSSSSSSSQSESSSIGGSRQGFKTTRFGWVTSVVGGCNTVWGGFQVLHGGGEGVIPKGGKRLIQDGLGGVAFCLGGAGFPETAT